MRKSSISIIYLGTVLLIISVIIILIVVFNIKNDIVLEKKLFRSSEKLFKEQKRINVLFITESNIPKDFFDIFKSMKENVIVDKIKYFDLEKIKEYDVVICDKKISTTTERNILSEILKMNKKIILFKDCRDILLDNQIGIEYNGVINLQKGKEYILEVPFNNLINPSVKKYTYIPLYNYEINNIFCKGTESVIRISGKDVICFDRNKELYISYTLTDFFDDKFYFRKNIIKRFLEY